MKIAITATGDNLEAQVDSRFGRCDSFLIVDLETLDFETVDNPHATAGGGAGIQAAQLMAEKQVDAVLTGNCGPNAFRVFAQAGIDIYIGASGQIKDAIETFKAGDFQKATDANVGSHFGMGGRGRGRRF